MKTLAKPMPAGHAPAPATGAAALLARLHALFAAIPLSAVALLARFSIAAVFWKSGQTKVQGLEIDLVEGRFALGWPRLSDSVVDLFRHEYELPLLPPEIGAVMAATAEHLLPIALLLGIATRLSALALLGMTAVIQVFVYPGAYPTHGTWAAVLLYLIVTGPGRMSIDHWLARRFGGGAG